MSTRIVMVGEEAMLMPGEEEPPIFTWTEYVPTYGPPEPLLLSESPDDQHWLVMDWDADALDDGPYVEHPAECAVLPGWTARCGIQWEIENAGIPDEMWPREPGRWRVEQWVERYPGGPWGPAEVDTGMRWVSEEPRHTGRPL